ncbi:hypothetical protein AAG565_14315 [Fontimonas sp. SYSU GA230001]|uniref:hypothetical protein n=1 Tax=Fontimonas sp. SYSU GA230001 TaxID=3142450 RepID=UPI0032B5B061
MSYQGRSGIVEEAARIVCVELVTDYGQAKRRAAQRLGLPSQAGLPDNAAVHAAVLDYLRLFGGDEYRRRLRQMRSTALSAMRMLAAYSPRLAGATLSGAVTAAHRVQLHLFAESAEAVDIELLNRGVAFEHGERRYRYADGGERNVPLLRLDVGGVGVDAAVFAPDDLRRAPLSPLDGRPFRRADLAEVERLLESG